MTDQEIEKLREKLGSEYSVKRQNGAITVELVDIWEGVDFAINRKSDKVYKIINIYAWNLLLQTEERVDLFHKEYFKPSTESAYVEQLKDKAKELYGEIKDGDRFDASMFGSSNNVSININDDPIWSYSKGWDLLSLGGFRLYQQGKWAKKVEQPIKVNVSSVRYSREPIEHMGELIPSDTIDCTVHFTIEGSSPKIILKDDFRNLLTKCLEDYLNKIP